jgi:hypothetical protein
MGVPWLGIVSFSWAVGESLKDVPAKCFKIGCVFDEFKPEYSEAR